MALVGTELLQVVPLRADGTPSPVSEVVNTQSIADLAYSSGDLTANELLIGAGSGSSPSPLGSLGTVSTVLHGNAAGAPSFSAVDLTADVAGRLPLTNVATIANSTILGNNSGSAGTISALTGTQVAAVLSGAINGTSLGITTAAAAKVTTLVATGTITPSTTSGLVGTTLGDNAQAGSVGEYVSANLVAGSAIPLTTGTAFNITSISLTAGDWDVWGSLCFTPSGAGVVVWLGSISTTSATFPNQPNNGAYISVPAVPSTSIAPTLPTGMTRLNLSSTTIVYLVAQSTFSVATQTAYGFIGARRIR